MPDKKNEVKDYIHPDLLKLAEQMLVFSGDLGDEDVLEDFWENAKRIELDDCEFGDKVRIYWNVEGERFSDIGYLTTVPFVLDEQKPEFSGVIHVPTPQNPGGMEQPSGEWITVFDAIKNPHIVSIKPLRRR